jgi:chromosome segregation ATPase
VADYTELKRLAEASLGEWYEFGELRCEDRSGYINGLHHDDEYFIAAANPAAVLSLIAENDSQRKDLQNLRTDNAQLLYALKQEEQSYLVLRAERDQLKAENERQAAQFKEWQASHHANYCSVAEERDQLRAEVAGLQTGYKAYEQVNAELRAEVEALRKALTYIRDSSDDWHVCEKAADALIDAAMGQGEQP